MNDRYFKVRVPATSANMGPGFDSLGIAFKLFNEYIFAEIESGVKFIGFQSEFANKNNIIFKAMEKVFKDYNYDYSGLRIEIINCNIPVSRGLGSSSSCIIAGIIGAFSIMGKDINKSEVLKYAVEIEGHPDNVCPAIYGGMVTVVVEDDTLIREGLSEFLSESGYSIIQAKDGKEALEKFNTDIHLVILDIQIPYINGLDVLKEIRKESDLPVLILTAFSNEEFKIDAYTNLADGYIEKPFSLPVLKARIDALLQKQDIFEYKNVCVNFKSYTAKIDGKTIDINAKELEILKYLLDHAGIALSRAQILDHVWKESEDVPYDRVIDVYIKELRKKLGLDCITTIRNVGYKFFIISHKPKVCIVEVYINLSKTNQARNHRC